MVKVAICSFCILLSACQTPKGGFCAIAQPIRLSAATVDAMTDAEVKAALSHNRKGQKICGWAQ